MRNLILIAVAAVAFCVVGIAHPNVLIAQDYVEEDLESDRERFLGGLGHPHLCQADSV